LCAEALYDLYILLFKPATDGEALESNPKLKQRLLCGILGCNDDYANAIRIILSQKLLADRDVNVYLLGNRVKFIYALGARFTVEFRKVLESPEFKFEKLGVAAMKAIVRLVKNSSGSIDILCGFWERYEVMHDAVASYILSSLLESLNDEFVEKEIIWNCLKEFIQNLKVPTPKIVVLTAIITSSPSPPRGAMDHHFDTFQLNYDSSSLGNVQEMIYVPFSSKDTSVRYLKEVLLPLCDKRFDVENELTGKINTMATLCLFNHYTIDVLADAQIHLRLLKYFQISEIQLVPGTFSVQRYVKSAADCLLNISKYEKELKVRNIQPKKQILSISDIMKPIVLELFNESVLETTLESKKFSNMTKVKIIFELEGIDKSILAGVNAQNVHEKQCVYSLMGEVYSKMNNMINY
jgi:hypothetical protein